MKKSGCCLLSMLLMLHFSFSQEIISRDSVSGKKYADISYKTGAQLSDYEKERCKLDIYIPGKMAVGKPVFIYFHGGGLSAGDKSEGWADWSNNFGYKFLQSGVTLVMVNYRLSGKNNARWPDYLRDAAAAVTWVQQNIAGYGPDRGNIFIGGFSAGAYITHMLNIDTSWLTEAKADRKKIRGFIAISGQTRQHATVATDLGVQQEELLNAKPFAMPLGLVRKTNMPLYIFVGEKEGQTITANETYYEELLNKGSRNIFFYIQPGKVHGGMRDGLGDSESPARTRILDFIKQFSKK